MGRIDLPDKPRDEDNPPLPPFLSPRQLQVMRCCARGLTAASTARALEIGLETVKTHRKAVIAKLGAHSSAHAVAILAAAEALFDSDLDGEATLRELSSAYWSNRYSWLQLQLAEPRGRVLS